MSTSSSNKIVEERSQVTSANGLAPELRKLFWEYDFDSLSWERNSHFIIKRILTHGELRAWDWLRDQIGEAALRQWILDSKGAGMDKRRLRYWELILDLPGDEVNRWVAAQASSIWGRRSKRLDHESAD